ncbi:MAG TPA: substrate-binding domain-containing protein, partial [Polyangiaceae bacterium]
MQSPELPAAYPASSKRRTVAVLVDYIDHFSGGYESALRSSFQQVCEERDFDLVVVVGRAIDAPDSRDRLHNAIYDLLGRAVDGVVLVAGGLTTFSGPAGIQRLREVIGPKPIASLGLAVPDVPHVVLEQQSGMRALVEHVVVHHGRRRVVYLSGPEHNTDALVRLQVCRDTLAEHGIELGPERVSCGAFNYVTGMQAMEELLARGEAFDAVIAANDGMATGALATLEAHGVNVPHDVIVTGFDDIPLARLGEPALTTVGQPLARMARIALNLVARQLDGESVPERTEIPAEVVIRASCGCGGAAARQKSMPVPARSRPASLELKLQFESIAQRCEAGLRDGHLEWVRVILRGLLREVEGQTGALDAALRHCLTGIGQHRELYASLELAVNLLWDELRRVLPELESMFAGAREQVLRAYNRAQAQHIWDEETTYTQILRSGERLSIVLDLPELRRALREVLPAMGIRNAFISLYTDPTRQQLEPFFCLYEGELLPEAMRPFDAHELIPPATRASEQRRTLFALPLASETQHWGVAVIGFGQGIGAHELLREQLSAALTTVALHREIIDKTKLHERSVQERLATAERMNALSVLAGGVAHDLNNALGPLVALPDLIRKELLRRHPDLADGDVEALTDLDHIRSSALRAAQVVKDLLTLGRQGKTELSALDLNETLKDCLVEARLRFPSKGERASSVVLRAPAEPLPIRGASQQLARAISNLIQNALEANREQSPVVVSASRQRLSEPLQGYETVEPGDYAVVCVSDCGQGISNLALQRIFEPFFSSKRLAEHSGT